MGEEQLLELRGCVEEVVFRNKENGYSVLNMVCDGVFATAVGNMADVSAGDELKLIGVWKNNPYYGDQFAFQYYEHIMPETAEDILRYLSMRSVKGVGAVMAVRLVDAFGDDTIEVMKNQPERLEQIKGISHEKAIAISEEIKKVFGMKEIMTSLGKYSISAVEAVRIWKSLGTSAVTMIENDPYILCGTDISMDFNKADGIAERLGIEADDKQRIRAGTIYLIEYNAGNGHTCLPKKKLSTAAAKFLRLEEEKIAPVISEMISDGTLICDEIYDEEYAFLPSYYRSETFCAERLDTLLQIPPSRISATDALITAFEKRNNLEYADLQRKAISEALNGGILILTGGPGTGKTTALNAIINLYEQSGLSVSLAAPTGRAAKRMTELTGKEAKTIHRLLEVEWGKNDVPHFTRNERHLLECDALIIDEMSMIDVTLMEAVLRALPLGCRLVMVGDTDQLPSVGAGNVLGDMIASGRLPVVQLTEIFRQSMESLIITNAHKIIHGEMPDLMKKDKDFFFISESGPEDICSKLVDLYIRRLPAAYNYSPLSDIQILCPGRKGALGVTEINRRIQGIINPPDKTKSEVKMPVYTLRVGDKVMQTKNNYDLPWERDDGSDGAGIYNGDIGVIISIEKNSGNAEIRFDDKVVSYQREQLLDVDLAYAATVHKSQGSEFRAVLMPMYMGPSQLYYRNLLYTAVTRAREIIILVGNVSTLKYMVDNNKKTRRYSGLRFFLERSSE